MEPFRPGDLVRLRESPTDTLGRIVSLSADGLRTEVRWQKRPGYEHQITVESVEDLRRIHESEEGMI
jgi:hypothetical protein